MLQELALRLRQSNITLNCIKLVFVIWSLSALGVFEQYKAEMAKKYDDHFIVYSVFWLVLSGLAYLLKLFYDANTLDDVSRALGMTLTYLLLPIVFIFFLFLQILLITFSPWDAGLITLFTAIPSIFLGIRFWQVVRAQTT